MSHALLISFFLTCSPEYYLVRSTDYKALRFVVFPFPCYLVLLTPKYLLSTLFLNTLTLHSSQSVRDLSFTSIQNNRQNYSSVCVNAYIVGSRQNVGKMANGMCAVIEMKWERVFISCVHRTWFSACVVLSLSCWPVSVINFFIIWQIYLRFENDHNCGTVIFSFQVCWNALMKYP